MKTNIQPKKTQGTKILMAFTFLMCCLAGRAQSKFQIATSTVSFFSSAPMEDIEAHNKNAKGIVDFGANTFLIKIPIKGFDFSSDLMEEHFNENYLESSKYPDAVFRGSFQGVYDLQKDGQYPVTATGDFLLHGVTQKRTIPCVITVRNGAAQVNSSFSIKLADHKIDIPTVVFKKIAEVVDVKIDAALAKI